MERDGEERDEDRDRCVEKDVLMSMSMLVLMFG